MPDQNIEADVQTLRQQLSDVALRITGMQDQRERAKASSRKILKLCGFLGLAHAGGALWILTMGVLDHKALHAAVPALLFSTVAISMLICAIKAQTEDKR